MHALLSLVAPSPHCALALDTMMMLIAPADSTQSSSEHSAFAVNKRDFTL